MKIMVHLLRLYLKPKGNKSMIKTCSALVESCADVWDVPVTRQLVDNKYNLFDPLDLACGETACHIQDSIDLITSHCLW